MATHPLLVALESLRLPPLPSAGSPNSARQDGLAWRLEPQGASMRVEPHRWDTASRGWSLGSRVTLRDLPQDPDVPSLEAFRAWSRAPERGPWTLLQTLAGHPRVLWADSSGDPGQPVQLQVHVPHLWVEAVPEGFLLRLDPMPEAAPARLIRHGERLGVTLFSPLHRALAQVLRHPQPVSKAQEAALASVLGRLVPHVRMVTAVKPHGDWPVAPAEGSLQVWLSGGTRELRVTVGVVPAPGAPWMAPGLGPLWVVAGPPHQRFLRQRDRILEAGRLERVRACPGGCETGGTSWTVTGLETVGAFLTELQGQGSRVRLQGVPARMPELPRALDASDLALRVSKKARGMMVEGSLAGQPLSTVWAALRRAQRFLELPGGRLLDLHGVVGSRLKSLAAWHPETVLPETAALALEGLVAPQAWPRTPLPVPDEPPPSFHGCLRPYQGEGFRWMAHRLSVAGGALLADDMGLGKTVQTAALLAHRRDCGPALVVAPTSVVGQWQSELARFAPDLVLRLWGESAVPRAGEVWMVSYGRLIQGDAALLGTRWGTVVLDEAHAIKNAASQRAQLSQQLQAEARLALTGTPVENHPEELRSLLGWLLPSLGPRLAAVADADELKALAAPFLLRRTKAAVLHELPPLVQQVLELQPDDTEQAFQEALLAREREAAGSGDALHVLAALMRLRRACAHPQLVEADYSGAGVKVDALLERLTVLREEGRRSLVFSQFTDLLDRVEPLLVQAGHRVLRLDGRTPAAQRTQRVKAFQEGRADVFLISLKAGGSGLNLTEADDVFLMDPWWNPAVEDQATARAHRMGRTRPVMVHRLVLRGSIETRMLELHAAKRAMVEQLLAGQAVPASLDLEALRGLLLGS